MDARFTALYERALKELTGNILPWWMRYAPDEKNGGFYGEVDNDNLPVHGANRFITLAARLIWTFAASYRVLGEEQYLHMARRAYDDFIRRFWDEQTQGAHTLVSDDGRVLDDHKFIYGNAFTIYGFSEYARATGDQEALRRARSLMERLEAHVYDPVHKGYYEACRRDWTVDPWIRGVNRAPSDIKTMNTHLHLIEAYTNLLRADGSARVRAKVREHLYVMRNKIVNHDIHHFHYFQDRAWQPTTADISYGHDIEGSWLMLETAEVLGEPEAHRDVRDMCVNMARACLEEGLTPEGAMLTEYDPCTGKVHQSLSWWEQNEAVVGFLNAWQETGEEQFIQAALRCYDFLDEHFVDHEKGGWFARLALEDHRVISNRKATGTICPYHNARMCLEIVERYRKAQAQERQ